MIKIIVDAMGGDNAPRSTVAGAVSALESYLVKNGYEMEEVSFEEDTFHIVLKVESDEDELVKNDLMKTDLLNKISEDALYFNRGMILSFVVKENAK